MRIDGTIDAAQNIENSGLSVAGRVDVRESQNLETERDPNLIEIRVPI